MGSFVGEQHVWLIADKTGDWTCYFDAGPAGHSIVISGDSIEKWAVIETLWIFSNRPFVEKSKKTMRDSLNHRDGMTW